MVYIIKSEKNNDLIVKDGYIFELKEIRGFRHYWRCNKRSCSARFVTNQFYKANLGQISVKNQHNHPIDNNELIKKTMVYKMKKKIEEGVMCTRSVISAVLTGLCRENIEATGTIENLSTILRRYKNSYLNPKPYLFSDIHLSKQLAYTHRNELFYQFGLGNYRNYSENSNFLIFYSDSLFNSLLNEEMLCIDGTFKVVPSPYYQLLTISILKNCTVFPIVYIICKNKTQETYENIFTTLFHLKRYFSPKFFKCDFELALIEAIKIKFPNSTISGCQFHLGQAIQRKMRQLNLFYFYKSNQQIKKYVKCLTALAYVRPEKIFETFNEIRSSDGFPVILYVLYDYFLSNYIENLNNVRFPINLWNVFQHFTFEIPRTNNAIEGWHNAFNGLFGNSAPSLTLLIYNLKNEEENVQQRLIRLNIGENFRRKIRYELMERRLYEKMNSTAEHFGKNYVFSLVDLLFY